MMMLWLWLAAAFASPLELEEVLDAVDTRVPQLAAEQARLEQAEADLLARRGAFDPALEALFSGYDKKNPRQYLRTGVRVDTIYGPSFSAAWQRGVGTFPPYDEERKTGPAGEAVLITDVPLLNGFVVPKARTELQVAAIDNAKAEAKVRDAMRKLHAKAAGAYWKWVAAGAKLQAEIKLLEQLQGQQTALESQAEVGARSRLEVLDNKRAVMQRMDAMAQARADLDVAALNLSLWFRDDTGAPIIPAPDRLPEMPESDPILPPGALDQAQPVRPDIAAAELAVEGASIKLARARLDVLPKLNLKGRARLPLDAVGKTELYGGLQLDMPLLFREGIGSRQAALADQAWYRQQLRFAQDQARTEVEQARRRLLWAQERVRWTEEAEDLAEEVVQMARRQFEVGAGDIFQLLGREVNFVKARKANIEALLALRLAATDLIAALGLPPEATTD